jgi:hypothetical protein
MMSIISSRRSLFAALVTAAVFSVGHPLASAQPIPGNPQNPYESSDDPSDDSSDDADAPDVPAEAPPAEAPPAPPAEAPPIQAPQRVQRAPNPPGVQPQPPPQAVTGQWVFTQQYGWLWMPYGDQYVSTPQATAGVTVYPYAYVYYPAYGWTWLSAPWVWGGGPSIHFSVGPRYYHWYHRPHFVGRGIIRGPVRGYHPGFRGGIRGHIGPSRFGGHLRGGHFGHRR